MATVTGMTAAAMQAIRDGTVVNAIFDSANHLILTKYDGTQIDAGVVSTSTTTASGLVELATSAETLTGTDATRAVTPAGLASIPGYKVQVLAANSLAENAASTAYPLGTSIMSLTTGSGWTVNSGFGAIITNKSETDRAMQTCFPNSGGFNPPRSWQRMYHSTAGGGGWTAWAQSMLMVNSDPTIFNQSTGMSVYPVGQSRLYYTSVNSSGWDFNGKNGEVLTYYDGVDFARQQWIKHQGGTSAATEIWIRTANSASGWSNWRIVADDQPDTGWVTLTVTGSGYVMKRPCAYRIKQGICYLKGAFTCPTGGYTTALTLPTAARPAEDKNFAAAVNASIFMSGLITASTGAVQTWLSAATGGWFVLDGVTYPLG